MRSFTEQSTTEDDDEIEESPDLTPEERAEALWERYEHLFREHKGSASRKSDDAPEVHTDWAAHEVHTARGYKKGDNPFPPNYVRAELCTLEALREKDEKRFENVKANIASMSVSGMSVEEISDVLRVQPWDVEAELERVRREEP